MTESVEQPTNEDGAAAPPQFSEDETYQMKISDIVVDHEAQSRQGGVDEQLVSQYVQDMQNGAAFPPLVVFFDGQQYLLGAGFHRREAYLKCAVESVLVKIKPGTLRDAYVENLVSNLSHGKPLSLADRKENASRLLRDTEWAKKSDSEIGRLTPRAQINQPA